MTSVLGDKSREASELKKEVLSLMTALSASQAALHKWQEDSRNAPAAGGGDDDDMTKQAIRQLSQLVKDKDFEIAALSQKNNTLLQVVLSLSMYLFLSLFVSLNVLFLISLCLFQRTLFYLLLFLPMFFSISSLPSTHPPLLIHPSTPPTTTTGVTKRIGR